MLWKIDVGLVLYDWMYNKCKIYIDDVYITLLCLCEVQSIWSQARVQAWGGRLHAHSWKWGNTLFRWSTL